MREYYPDMLKSKSYIPKYLRPSVALLYKFLQKKSLKKYLTSTKRCAKITKPTRTANGTNEKMNLDN